MNRLPKDPARLKGLRVAVLAAVWLTLAPSTSMAGEPFADAVSGPFEISTFDPRYHDNPRDWLGDLGQFNIFGASGQLFTSAAVGLNPSHDPRDMASGVKLSGQAGEWKVDILGVQDRDDTHRDLRNGLVARITRTLFEQSSLGFTFTSGDPETGQEANTVGMDFQYRTDGPLQGQAWIQQVDNPGADEGDDGAWGLRLHYPDGQHELDARFEHYGDAFDPALGAVSRPGVDDARFEYRFRHDEERTGAWRLGHALSVSDTRSIDSDEASGFLRMSLLEANGPSGDGWQLFASAHREVLVDGFTLVDRLEVNPGEYRYQRYGLDYRTERLEDLTLGLRITAGDYLQGSRQDLRLRSEWRAADWLRLDAEYALSDHEQPTGHFMARTLSLKSEFTLLPGWSLSPGVQFNNVNEQLGLNARLHWRHGPGRDLFLVWNRTVLRNLEDRLLAPLQDSVLRGIYKLRF